MYTTLNLLVDGSTPSPFHNVLTFAVCTLPFVVCAEDEGEGTSSISISQFYPTNYEEIVSEVILYDIDAIRHTCMPLSSAWS